MIAYLTILRGMPTYGSHCYRLYAQDEQNELHSDMIAAVTCKSMCFIDPRSLAISSELMLPNIVSWGYSEGSLMLELVSEYHSSGSGSGAEGAATENKKGDGGGCQTSRPASAWGLLWFAAALLGLRSVRSARRHQDAAAKG